MKGEKEKEFLQFQVQRKVVSLYKSFLFILEDLKAQGYDIDEDMYQRCRKRVLDQGNDTIREIEDYLNNFDVRLK
jgi:predicted esterase YcpF (UPF0227 family)|tara:strand:- start:142 stop:366 length:225 start_codon:yes stop_codon:yes gene_type:complete